MSDSLMNRSSTLMCVSETEGVLPGSISFVNYRCIQSHTPTVYIPVQLQKDRSLFHEVMKCTQLLSQKDVLIERTNTMKTN